MGIPVKVRDTLAHSHSYLALALFTPLLALGPLALLLRPDIFPAPIRPEKVTADEARRFLMAAFVAVRAMSQSLWALWLVPYEIPVSTSAAVGVFNAVLDAVCCAAALRATKDLSADIVSQLGAGLFLAGVLLERIPEIERRRLVCFHPPPTRLTPLARLCQLQSTKQVPR
jgi:hypothetical protein